MNYEKGKVEKNVFIERCIKERGFDTIEDAAENLDIPLEVLAALMYSPLPDLDDVGLKYIASQFGYNLEDWFFHWRMGLGKSTWEQSNKIGAE